MLRGKAPFNQLRNAVYAFASFLRRSGRDDVAADLRTMGRNVARTFSAYWLPGDGALADRLRQTYRFATGARASVSTDADGEVVVVETKHCRFCNYPVPGAPTAGCELVVGFVAELLGLDAEGVRASRAFGDQSCVHAFRPRDEDAPAGR